LSVVTVGAMDSEGPGATPIKYRSFGEWPVMAYTAAAILALASQCALNVAPQTVAAIVQTESHGRPFALNVNGGSQPPAQNNAASAAATAQRYIAAGYSVCPSSEHLAQVSA